jgi:hypothetical protein
MEFCDSSGELAELDRGSRGDSALRCGAESFTVLTDSRRKLLDFEQESTEMNAEAGLAGHGMVLS